MRHCDAVCLCQLKIKLPKQKNKKTKKMDKSTSNRGNFNKILGVLHDREYEDVSKSSLSIFTTVRDWECTKRMYSFHLVCFFSCSTIYSCHYDNMSSSKIIIKQIITHAMTFSACAQTQTMSILCVCVWCLSCDLCDNWVLEGTQSNATSLLYDRACMVHVRD